MTHKQQTSNQISFHKAIKINALSGDFYTKIINGKNHISHFEIARRFNLNPINVRDILDDFAMQAGQSDTVYSEGFLRWADAVAFSALVIELRVHEELTNAVLMSLTDLECVA